MSIELHDHYINDYVFVMDRLVDSARDVELLVKSEILESKLPDSEAAAEFINSLAHYAPQSTATASKPFLTHGQANPKIVL
ncbi:unnamed protein product [Prunus armeniaca]